MTTDEMVDDNGGVSRRKVLTHVAVGTAVVWAAPVLTSINTPAFAASPAPNACAPADCANPIGGLCGSGVNGFACLCFRTTAGLCFCGNDAFCSDLQPCDAATPCPAGQMCLDPGNGCGESVCAPPCGASALAAVSPFARSAIRNDQPQESNRPTLSGRPR